MRLGLSSSILCAVREQFTQPFVRLGLFVTPWEMSPPSLVPKVKRKEQKKEEEKQKR